MRAIVYDRYGSPEVLRLEEVDKPTPRDDEVLIKVEAVSLNASDWEFLRGKPAYARIMGLRKPRIRTLGSDVAGTVVAVGRKVGRFQPGDAVFGDLFGLWGGFAEYARARPDMLVRKPAGMTFEAAAALPQAGVIALQGICQRGRARPGQKILINGAGGSAGTFAVQLAKRAGAEVTGVDSGPKLDRIRALGADHVIDYTREDFARNGQGYDLILDLVASRSVADCRRALCATGTYLLVGGSMAALLEVLVLGSVLSRIGSKKVAVLGVKQNGADMETVAELVETGQLTPVLDKRFALHEVPEALQHLGDGRAIGKVIVTPWASGEA